MNNFTPFLASYNELVEQWQERLRILKCMEEKAVEFPELMRMIWVFKQSCVEFQNFQAKLDYFSAGFPSGDLFNHWQELSSDFNKIRACFAALELSIDKYQQSRAMAEPSPLTPVDLFHPSVNIPSIHNSKSNAAKMGGSRILKKKPRKLIISIPIHTVEGSFFDGIKRARIVTREPGELTLILRVSKEYLILNARPPLDMEEEMRLLKVQAELEAESQAKAAAKSQAKAEEEAQLQQAASQFPFNSDNPASLESCKEAISDGGMPVSMSRLQASGMEEIRQALITTTNQMYLSHKQTAKASMIKRRVRKQFQLDNNFFQKNGFINGAAKVLRRGDCDAKIKRRACYLIVKETLRSLSDSVDTKEGAEGSNGQQQRSAKEDELKEIESPGGYEDSQLSISKLLAENKRLEAANNELIYDVDKNEAELSELREEMRLIRYNEGRLEDITNSLEASRSSTDKALNILTSLKKKDNTYRERVLALKKELKACKTERDEALANLGHQTESFENEHKTLIDENTKLKGTLTSFKRKLDDVMEDVEDVTSNKKR
ncbi:hypothetical protein BCON_0281g00060 [Botryotinia convoluta]|uniref:Uncharacterized protein n=1 Tax=Botryotinia convoluta TaxID=54673 RepID=A0A4Z1HG73_9HELO|nr:hypothetical protein BCON_0281g00060 [Botryotinia convoluta]